MGAAAGAGDGSALAPRPGAANAAARTVTVARRFMRLRFRLAAARPLRAKRARGTKPRSRAPVHEGVNPILATFLRVTATVAVVLVALILAAVLLKIVLIAALVAAVLTGGFFLYQLVVKRKTKLSVLR